MTYVGGLLDQASGEGEGKGVGGWSGGFDGEGCQLGCVFRGQMGEDDGEGHFRLDEFYSPCTLIYDLGVVEYEVDNFA